MRIIKVEKTGAEIFQFDSMAEVSGYIDPSVFEPTDDEAKQRFVGENLPGWDAANNRFLSTWEHGMEILNMYRDKLKGAELPELKSRQRFTSYQETEGDEFDYDRFMQGLPPWKVTKREKADGPATVTVVIDTTAECFRDSLDLFWRGAAALALTELCEAKGYGVELWVVNGSRAFEGFHHPLVTAANVKKPQDPLDISTLSNTVAGWFYRSFTFSLIRSIGKKTDREIKETLGHVYTPTATDLNTLTTDELRVYSAGHFSFSGALGVIQNEVKRISEAEETGKQAE
jgi:hypothetical protein